MDNYWIKVKNKLNIHFLLILAVFPFNVLRLFTAMLTSGVFLLIMATLPINVIIINLLSKSKKCYRYFTFNYRNIDNCYWNPWRYFTGGDLCKWSNTSNCCRDGFCPIYCKSKRIDLQILPLSGNVYCYNVFFYSLSNSFCKSN